MRNQLQPHTHISVDIVKMALQRYIRLSVRWSGYKRSPLKALQHDVDDRFHSLYFIGIKNFCCNIELSKQFIYFRGNFWFKPLKIINLGYS